MGADERSPADEYWRKHSPSAAFLLDCIVGPVTWFRKNIVEPNQKEYYWYHRKYNRVPTVDQCYDDDNVCKFEATAQFKRDQKVDCLVIDLLRERFDDCQLYEGHDKAIKCEPLYEDWFNAAGNYFTKYGDLSYARTAEHAFMKQKHRALWERRHGPVGTGMKDKNGNPLPLDQYPPLPVYRVE